MILERIINLLFPRNCVICRKNTQRIDLCEFCWKKLPRFSTEEIFAPFKYQEPINDFITALKFGEKLPYAKLLSEIMYEPLLEYYQNRPKPEIIIPVPLHKKRLRERGFNQALEIAKPLAKKLQIPLDYNFVIRVKNTLAQSSLSVKDRQKNIRNAFLIQKKIAAKQKYQHVAIIDDVITTGNTIDELCKVLRENGITKIDIWCAAKT
jgi:ComF family protein